MKKIYILPAMLAFGLCAPAIANDKVTAETQSKTKVEKDADGNYTKKQTSTAESTDAQGTTTKSETKVNVETDANGNAERKVTTESSTDPKGLMNKTKTVTTDNVKYKDGKMLTHRQILKEVWGDAHTDDMQYLRVYISQLRDKVEPDPSAPTYIVTEPGIGYRMETFAESPALPIAATA